MLAGLPKAPSAYNPVVNPKRARMRQQYILQRMAQLGYITPAQYEEAKNEELKVKTDSSAFGVHAEYVSEMARQLVYEQFKEDTYTRGLNVYTTITKADQDAAYIALRKGVMDYEKRHGYRGPEAYIEIPKTKAEADDAIETELADHPDSDDIIAAMVLQASPKSLQAVTSAGEEITISGDGLKLAANALTDKAKDNVRLRPGVQQQFVNALPAGTIIREQDLERVLLRDVRAWMPDAKQARALHRLHSEMQMLLYTHAFNDERAARGLPVVNSFWVHGTGPLPTPAPTPTTVPTVPTTLRDAALREDWRTWATAWAALDSGPVADLLRQSESGAPVQLTLCGERNAQGFHSAPRGLAQRIQGFFRPQRFMDLRNQL